MERHYGVTAPVIDRWFREHDIEYIPPKYNRRPSRDELIELHHGQKMTIQQLCKHYGRGDQYITGWLKEYGIEQRYYRRKRKTELSPEDHKNLLVELHHEQQMTLKDISKVFDVSDVLVSVWFQEYDIEVKEFYTTNGTSQGEIELYEYISSLGFDVMRDRSILDDKQQIGCFVPDKQIGFEYNGLYWHSDSFLSPSYHLNKLKNANRNNIDLVQIFEDEWLEKKDICKSIISSKLGKNATVYARKCEIRDVDVKTSKKFLDEHHLQESPNSIKYSFGLFHNDELVCLLTYGIHHRLRAMDSLVLNRLCTKSFINVVGGASKLFKHSLKILPNRKIISWSDKRWSTGNIYRSLGFELEDTLKPDYWYIKSQKRYPKQRFQKKMIDCPDDMTEYDRMKELGYSRVWDCGKDRWVY